MTTWAKGGNQVATAAELVKKFVGFDFHNRFALARTYSPHACKEILINKQRAKLIEYQKFRVASHAELGSDLAVARFVVSMRGRMQCGDSKWISKYHELPEKYSDSFKLTAIELVDEDLVTEGVDNFIGLDYLESLNLRGNIYLDDFACDQLGRQFRSSKTLGQIDLSRIPFITVYGLETLLRIKSLRKISAIGTQASKFAEMDLFAAAAQDECGCKVMVHEDGRQFRDPDLEVAYEETIPLLEAPQEQKQSFGR